MNFIRSIENPVKVLNATWLTVRSTSDSNIFRSKRSTGKAIVNFISDLTVSETNMDKIKHAISSSIADADPDIYHYFDQESLSSFDIKFITPDIKDDELISLTMIIYLTPFDGALALQWGPIMKKETEAVIQYKYESALLWVINAYTLVIDYRVVEGEVRFNAKTTLTGWVSKFQDWRNGFEISPTDSINLLIKDANAHLYMAFYWANVLKSPSFGALIDEPIVVGINSTFKPDINEINKIIGLLPFLK